jgi:hypothetical protein
MRNRFQAASSFSISGMGCARLVRFRFSLPSVKRMTRRFADSRMLPGPQGITYVNPADDPRKK